MIYIKDKLLKSYGNIELIGLDYNGGIKEISFTIYLINSEGKMFHRDIQVINENNYNSGSFCGKGIKNSFNLILSEMGRKTIKEI